MVPFHGPMSFATAGAPGIAQAIWPIRQVGRILLLAILVLGAGASAAADTETITGTLEVFVADDFDGGRAFPLYALRTDSGEQLELPDFDPPAGIAAGYGYAREHDYAFCGRVDADGQHPVGELARLLERVRSGACDVAVGSRFASGDGFAAYRYRPTAARRFGTAVLRRSMKVALRRPFLDATSGMYAANAKALPILARAYTSEAPEVQGLLRLQEAGMRVEEVPVDMRPRASGESKLQGKKAVMVVLTIAGTLLALDRWRRG